jgi:predicted amidohydrolase YtcJ
MTAQPLTRFAVAPLARMTRRLADVAAGRAEPDLVITGARVLSTYSERILPDREIWIAGGRIAAVKPAGHHRGGAPRYDARGGLIAPGLVDPHLHIESSMVTACAYADVSRSGVVAGTVLGTVRKMLRGAARASSSIHSTPFTSSTLPISWLSQTIVVVPLISAASA